MRQAARVVVLVNDVMACRVIKGNEPAPRIEPEVPLMAALSKPSKPAPCIVFVLNGRESGRGKRLLAQSALFVIQVPGLAPGRRDYGVLAVFGEETRVDLACIQVNGVGLAQEAERVEWIRHADISTVMTLSL